MRPSSQQKARARRKAGDAYRRLRRELDRLYRLGAARYPLSRADRLDLQNQAVDAQEQAGFLFWEVRHAIAAWGR